MILWAKMWENTAHKESVAFDAPGCGGSVTCYVRDVEILGSIPSTPTEVTA